MRSPLIIPSQTFVPEIEIKINGASLATTNMTALLDLRSVTVVADIEAPSMVALEFVTQDLVTGKMTWVDDRLFDVGNEVIVKMSFGGVSNTLITADITGLEPEFSTEDVPRVIVRGHDRRHRLMRGRKTQSFTKIKDSAIAAQVAREVGLSAKVTDTKVKLEYVLQHNQTNLEFLQNRAKRIGYEVVVEDKTLYFRPHQHTAQKTLTLTLGDNLLEFLPRLSSMNQINIVEVRGWDIKQKQAIVNQVKGSSSSMGKQMGTSTTRKAFGQASDVVINDPVSTPDEATQMAQGQLAARALYYITGDGECIGNPQLQAGRVIEIQGVGDRFSGLYYVVAATHLYNTDIGYKTRFTIRRDAT